MPLQGRRRIVGFAIILLLLAGGLALLAYPVSAEETGPVYSTSVSADELNVMVGFAPPSHYAEAGVTAGSDVTVTITVLLGAASTVIFSGDFPAGTFQISKVSVGNGGTVFLSVDTRAGTFTQLSVYARIFHYVTTYPYSLAGLLAVGLAGLFTLATEFGNTSFGKVARMILPVNKLGL